MQIDELFELAYILIDKKQVTAKEMAARFGVSVRTIYRWVEALSASGIPVYAVQGRGGGIAISEKYALDKTVLTEEERLAIVSSVKAMSKLSGSQKAALSANARAVEKISNLTSSEADWLEVDFAPWSPEGQGVRELFATLRDSILKKQQVEFDYFSSDGKKAGRIVHPWKLVYRGQAWYLLGWCTERKSERYFKLSRMLNVKITVRPADITFKSIHSSDSQKTVEVNSEKKLIQIEARVSSKMAFYLLDTFACSKVEPNQDESINVTFSAPDESWLCGLLLSFGAELKIISPEEIKEKIIQMAKETFSQYE